MRTLVKSILGGIYGTFRESNIALHVAKSEISWILVNVSPILDTLIGSSGEFQIDSVKRAYQTSGTI